MRVNIYAEEITPRVELVSKETGSQTFTGLRFYLELPATVEGAQYRGPFMHRPGDDDSSAVTFWGKRAMREVLTKALVLLDEYDEQQTVAPKLTAETINQDFSATFEPISLDMFRCTDSHGAERLLTAREILAWFRWHLGQRRRITAQVVKQL